MRVPVVQHHSRRRRALGRRALWTGGEFLVTAGVILLLLVVHQLWWTNREARQGAEHQVQALERQWATPDAGSGGTPSANDGSTGGSSPPRSPTNDGSTTSSGSGSGSATAPHRSQAYAVLTIPRLHLRVPIAEGVSKQNVLNKGYVGHYPGTQQPGQAGNFAIAGHRNTHGEPFRYLPSLRLKDTVQVETSAATFTYTVDKILPQTSAADSGVIRPVPRSIVKPSYGYSRPGYYVTLTTCTPEFTSRYRMVVWGTLTSTRPR